MNKERKKLYNSKLLFLGVISLIIIFGIILIGTLSGRYTFWLKRWKGSVVLGISDKLPLKTTENIEQLLEGVVSKTQEEVAKRVIESQAKIKTSLEKEISSMTRSQVEAFQLKICRDWGVISLSPTPTGSVGQ
ncbi:hypothetical protein A3D78_00160 [Candidatus Gottesmanbacteria bacterium RIFCSPHIGHO2_02_FULL_39_14]|uniref:Uncharacterized protein n=2 Tax=Candidatus Gottesmaniibacteriota TaxID=1752720 RepID=A0A1F5ZXG9_9BACT|nr:MAG: hypothetical protein A3D78_00160 [Candidatus Gottesmanbacteria bacterium RIFCSPHIGHO2_02_FULL_39_14]OGG31835.1 MAG: hypothetical protein A3I51_03120 [Candidatus Gottesmanbacteria bacterium RIFCSPLOWO2_02_FULL_38_8]